MEVSVDNLLTEIGRLHVANQVFTEQIAASRNEVNRLSGELAKFMLEKAEAENPANET